MKKKKTLTPLGSDKTMVYNYSLNSFHFEANRSHHLHSTQDTEHAITAYDLAVQHTALP